MNKITYFGDGQNKMFAFSFDFFQNDDICVEINGTRQTSGYKLTPIASTTPVDIPYVGGNITFDNAPSQADIVTIYRKIVTARNIDYQPTEKIDPETLNQDFNFLIEVIKDCRNAIDDFDAKYADFTNTPDYKTLINKLDATKKHLDLLGPVNNIATKDEINALQNGTGFTSNAISNIVSQATSYGHALNLNFLGLDAGEYTYTAEKSGFICLVLKSSVSQTVSCMLQEPSSSVKASIYTETLVPNNMSSIIIPISKGTNLIVSLGGTLISVNFQRLFPLKGAR